MLKDKYYIGSGQLRILKDYLEDLRKWFRPEAEMQYGSLENSIELSMRPEWLDIMPIQQKTLFCPQITFEDTVVEVEK